MSFLRDGPAELVALVFDNLRLRQLILASHVCQSWRTIARAHPVFYGGARLVETRPLTAELPEVQLFMARISTDYGPVSVTVLVYTVASLVDDIVLPALLTHMHRIKSLRISMPEDYSTSFRAILDQPAPALRRFMLEHYRGAPEGTAMVMPIGTLAFSAPADWVPRHLYELQPFCDRKADPGFVAIFRGRPTNAGSRHAIPETVRQITRSIFMVYKGISKMISDAYSARNVVILSPQSWGIRDTGIAL